MLKPQLVIGIAGGSGSGKSTVVERLLAGPHGASISLMPHDAYYYGFDRLPQTADGQRNWDHPEALETALYVQHVQQLLKCELVDRPVYDFAGHCRSSLTVRVEPRPILILEGILLLAIPEIRNLIDLKVFIETPSDLRLLRRTVRDLEERGRDPRSIALQYETTVRPMHELYVEPSRYYADVWIPWMKENTVALELIEARLCSAVPAVPF